MPERILAFTELVKTSKQANKQTSKQTNKQSCIDIDCKAVPLNQWATQARRRQLDADWVSVFFPQALNIVIGTIFNDVNSPALYLKAHRLFVDLYTKSSHLLQWVEQVLTQRITKDQKDVNQKYHEKYMELKAERMKLIQAIVKEKLGIGWCTFLFWA